VMFVARRGGQAVGRISAQVCQRAQSHQGKGLGHFGFFDCENNQATAVALFDAAEGWLRQNGMTRVVGPMSLSIHEEAGVLIDGFHRPPSIFMPHNPRYYGSLIESCGFAKAMDVLAYRLDIRAAYPERINRMMKAAARETKITLRPVDRRHIHHELNSLLAIFNEAWSENWGHIPMTEPEVQQLAIMVKRLFDRESVVLAEVNGQTAGFIVVLPNIHEFTADLGGRLFPSGWLRLLWRIKFTKYRSVRVPLMGIRKQFQNKRIGAAIAFSMIDHCRTHFVARGVSDCEMSWILEDNMAMRGILEASGSVVDKTYRLYEKPLV